MMGPDEIAHQERVDRFQGELDAFLAERWSLIAPAEGDGLDDEVRESLGSTYPSGWVLVVSASAIEVKRGKEFQHSHARFSAPNQLPWTGIGLLSDALCAWTG